MIENSISTLRSSLSKNALNIRVPHLKHQVCSDILLALATFLIEHECRSFSHNSKKEPKFPSDRHEDSTLHRIQESEWKRIVRSGYEMILESLDFEYNRSDDEICQFCLETLLEETLPALSTNEYRQIILDILPHFLQSLHTCYNDNKNHKLEYISTKILSSFQTILSTDSNALIPLIGCLSTIPLSEDGRKEVFQVTLSSLPVVPEEDLPIVVKTMLCSFISLENAIEAIEALRLECVALDARTNKDYSFLGKEELVETNEEVEEGGGVLLFLGYVVVEVMKQVDSAIMQFDVKERNYIEGGYLSEGWMQVLENHMKEKENTSRKDEGSMISWTGLDLIALLLLFQSNDYRSRVEDLLHRYILHPHGLPFEVFHNFIHQMRVGRFCNKKQNVAKSLNEVDKHGLISTPILRSLFEMTLWLLQIPCHKSFLQNQCANQEQAMYSTLGKISKVITHLCVTQPSIQEELIESLLSTSSLPFLQLSHHLSRPMRNKTTPDCAKKIVSGVRLIALTAVNIIASIARTSPRVVMPYHSCIFDRIKMESVMEIPCANEDKNIMRCPSSILMTCTHIIHRYCALIAFFMDSNRNDFSGDAERNNENIGCIESSTTLILVQKLLMNHDHKASVLNQLSHLNKFTISRFFPISLCQKQIVGIMLAMNLIISTPKPKLNEDDIQSLLLSVTKLMLRNPKIRSHLTSSYKSDSLCHHDQHPLICVHGCHFFHNIATSLSNTKQDRNVTTAIFRHVKNIVSSTNLVKLATDISKAHLKATESVLVYDKIYDIYVEPTISYADQQVQITKREMVICAYDYLVSDWWTSSWWQNSLGFTNFDSSLGNLHDNFYNLRECQVIYIYKLLDIYLDLGRKQSSNWVPDTWLLAKFQIPKFPPSVVVLFLSLNRSLPEKLVHDVGNDQVELNNGEFEFRSDNDHDDDSDSGLYDMWSFDADAPSVLGRQIVSPALDLCTTETLLKIGWSCVLSMSVCAVVLKHASQDMTTNSLFNKGTNLNGDSQPHYPLIQFQLSRFYDLKARAEICVVLLEKHIQSSPILKKNSMDQQVLKRKRKSLNKIRKIRKKQIIGVSLRERDDEYKHENQNFSSAEIERLGNLKLETKFLSQCVSKEYSSLIAPNILWNTLMNLSEYLYKEDVINKEASSNVKMITVPYNKSILNVFNLLIFLTDHLSFMINIDNRRNWISFLERLNHSQTISRDNGIFQMAKGDPFEFHIRGNSRELGRLKSDNLSGKVDEIELQHLSFFHDFSGINVIVRLTGILAKWLPVLRKIDYDPKYSLHYEGNESAQSSFLSLSKASRLLSSLYNFILLLLLETKDHESNNENPKASRNNFTTSSDSSLLPPLLRHILDGCAEESKAEKEGIDSKEPSSNIEVKDMNTYMPCQLEKIFNFFKAQLLDSCEDASLAAQLLDILFVLTKGYNKFLITSSITWKVLHTIYVTHRNSWMSRVSGPSKAFEFFMKEKMEEYKDSSAIQLCLKSLNKIAISKMKAYEQCRELRHFLLAYLSVIQQKGSASKFRKLFLALNAVLDDVSHKNTIKRINATNTSPKNSLPGLNDSTFSIFFEILVHMLLTSIAVSKPQKSFEVSAKNNVSPYKHLQDSSQLFVEAVDLFSRKFKLFPKRTFKSLLRVCALFLKVLERKVEECFDWRMKQPILSATQKENDHIDHASMSYLQLLMNQMVPCVLNISDFCKSLRNEAQKVRIGSSNVSDEWDKDEAYDSSEGMSGENWAFASNVKSISMLDLRCEGFIDTLREACRRHNLIPPKVQRSTEHQDPEATNRTHEKKKDPNQKKRRVPLQNRTSFNSQKFDNANQDEESNSYNEICDGDESLMENVREDRNRTSVDNSNSYLDSTVNSDVNSEDFSDAKSEAFSVANSDSDSDSFGAIGDWGD